MIIVLHILDVTGFLGLPPSITVFYFKGQKRLTEVWTDIGTKDKWTNILFNKTQFNGNKGRKLDINSKGRRDYRMPPKWTISQPS